jgi:1-acyl-sn-glycerol-3-phosphate acyltransferase
MILLRSLAFNIAFYLNMIVWMIALLPAFLLPRPVLWRLVRLWSRLNVGLLATLAGVKVVVRGLENLPAGGCIVASKHQSTFETLAALHLFHDPAYILKQELMRIPVFGWYARRLGMIPIDRKAGREALKTMSVRAKDEMAKGRSIVIYPEGTRQAPDSEPAYKIGVAFLYRDTGQTVVPVALNSGLFWPRHGFLRKPGTLIIEILPPIQSGLSMSDFMTRLQSEVEGATARLVAEAR